jgi:hypothetical protein
MMNRDNSLMMSLIILNKHYYIVISEIILKICLVAVRKNENKGLLCFTSNYQGASFAAASGCI